MRLIKVLWQHRGVEEATWERDDTICVNYPSCLRIEVRFFLVI